MNDEISGDLPNDGGLDCCICAQPIKPEGTWTQGHNAEPVAKGRCCAACNQTKVIPARLAEALGRKEGR